MRALALELGVAMLASFVAKCAERAAEAVCEALVGHDEVIE